MAAIRACPPRPASGEVDGSPEWRAFRMEIAFVVATLAATVDCGGDAWRVLAVKAIVSCRASLPDGTVKQVELTVEDRAGTVTVTKIT